MSSFSILCTSDVLCAVPGSQRVLVGSSGANCILSLLPDAYCTAVKTNNFSLAARQSRILFKKLKKVSSVKR